ncbi:MAG: pyridoxamine 5'-phosphate oxidase [Bacteroidetes bacterium]|nr:MAG: pyridoxamine 5'-phosphate oxidase [Bacteroidota bacterium]
MSRDISQLRRVYAGKYLNEDTVGKDPIELFNEWFDEAVKAEVLDANAFTLSTISEDGRPAGRIVLIKGVENGKFIFYTNYKSKKGSDLAANPVAAMTFYYKELDRQIRIEGTIEKHDEAASDEYFDTRPIKSRIGAWISAQSQPIPSRVYLMRKFVEYSLKHVGQKVKRPPFWGGYALTPDNIEFWQGRPNRLHDRINFRLVENDWEIDRLSP